MLAILLNRLLDQKAPERFPKPGGWLRSSWLRAADELMVAAEELTSVAREHSLLRAKMSKYRGLQDHQAWSDLLKPVLARYCKLH